MGGVLEHFKQKPEDSPFENKYSLRMSRSSRHKEKLNKCATKYCRNTREKGCKICSKCRKRLYKERHPERYTFTYVKNNARRRGKEWTITIDEFIQFITQTGYLFGKGREKDKLSIDRIDPLKGYHIDNIQILTVSENSSKGNYERDFESAVKGNYEEDLPF